MEHPTQIDYKGGLEDLAEDIGNLRYDALVKLFKLLKKKFERDSDKDAGYGRKKLSWELSCIASCLDTARKRAKEAWRISKPFMEVKEKAENHAPLNDVCEKCGKVYCDHENKY